MSVYNLTFSLAEKRNLSLAVVTAWRVACLQDAVDSGKAGSAHEELEKLAVNSLLPVEVKHTNGEPKVRISLLVSTNIFGCVDCVYSWLDKQACFM